MWTMKYHKFLYIWMQAKKTNNSNPGMYLIWRLTNHLNTIINKWTENLMTTNPMCADRFFCASFQHKAFVCHVDSRK